MKSTAIILSAGKGKRMKSNISKQYMLVNNCPVLYYTILAFENSNVDDIIIVCGKEDIQYIENEIVSKYQFKKIRNIVYGGKERYDSVYNGLIAINGSENVLIHDGARPLIKSEQINRIILELNSVNACVAGAPVKDTIKVVDENGIVKSTPDRSTLWQIQTPQAFKYELIMSCYKLQKEAQDGTITDDAMVVEKYSSEKVKIVNTGYDNIKITTPEDIDYMRYLLQSLIK